MDKAMDYNVLRYQVLSWLPFKFDLASKMYCRRRRFRPNGDAEGCRRVNGRPGIAKQLALSRINSTGRMQFMHALRAGVKSISRP